MSGGQYAALAYGVVFVVVLAYVAIIAAKLTRLQREVAELLEIARTAEAGVARRTPDYAARVPGASSTAGQGLDT